MSEEPPIVTGISPIEGVPGTKVTIRGENLGTCPEDVLGLIICGVDCLMSAEWKSNNKIIARSGGGTRKGDIIVVTLHGGRGTSTVQFKGIQEAMGPLKESAVWVDESVFDMSFGRKRPLSPILHEDPLELSTEGNERKELDDALEELFPHQSGNLCSANFSVEWYLLENHMNTSYNDLCAGVKRLQGKVTNPKKSENAFLKANVGSVLEQVNTLQELKCVFESDIQKFGRQSTEVLEKAIANCKSEAAELFDAVLERKERADSRRSALAAMRRFHFLFFLPARTDALIKSGDYDRVVNDYARAKALYSDTNVQLFRKFYEEVEKKINELRNILSSQLVKMPSTLEYQKKIIRNLHHLETEGDHAWSCLGARHAHLLMQLHATAAQHAGRKETSVDHAGSASSKGVEWQQSCPPVRVQLVEDVCAEVCAEFPDLWRLCQAYFGSELMPPNVALDHTKYPECKEMLLELLGVFSGVIRGALLAATLNPDDAAARRFLGQWAIPTAAEMTAMTPWMPQMLRHIRDCYNTLLMIDLPNDALDVVKILLFDLRVHCVTCMFKKTSTEVRFLHQREDWQLQVHEDGQMHTQLPVIFERLTSECGSVAVQTAITGGRRELCLLTQPAIASLAAALIHNTAVAFAQCLRRLCLKDPDQPDESFDSAISHSAPSPPSIERQLLITASNCSFTRTIVLPRLSGTLARAGYPKEEVEDAMSRAGEVFKELEGTLFDAYLEERIDPIIGSLEPSMYVGSFEWSHVRSAPNQVRSYVVEALLRVAHVHAEVTSICSDAVARLVGHAVVLIAEELHRLFRAAKGLSRHGVAQAHIDLEAVRFTLGIYVTKEARLIFEETVASFPKLNNDGERIKKEVLSSFRSRMRFLVASFSNDVPATVNGYQE